MGSLAGFGAALRVLRKGSDGTGTLQSLSDRTSIPIANLSKYELEKQWPSREVLERILEGVGVTFIDLAVEADRQARLSRGEEPGLPPPAPSGEFTEERIRAIVRQEFRAGLSSIAGLASDDISRVAQFIRDAGREPDLESVALLQSILDKRGSGE